jgi:hypothetical protein
MAGLAIILLGILHLVEPLQGGTFVHTIIEVELLSGLRTRDTVVWSGLAGLASQITLFADIIGQILSQGTGRATCAGFFAFQTLIVALGTYGLAVLVEGGKMVTRTLRQAFVLEQEHLRLARETMGTFCLASKAV